MINHKKSPPLVAGGQGRTVEDIKTDAYVVGTLFLAFACILTILVLIKEFADL